MANSTDLRERAERYARLRGSVIVDVLGGGVDGEVFATSAGTAVKVFERPATYLIERDV